MSLTSSPLQHLPTDVIGQLVSAYMLAILAHQIYLMTATQIITANFRQTNVAAAKNLAKNQRIG